MEKQEDYPERKTDEDLLEKILEEENRRALYRAIRRLEIKKREIIQMQYFGGMSQKEIAAEKFRTFFSTSVAQVPEAMSRREEEETPPKRGLFGGLFYRGKPEPETKEPAERGLELPPTGEIVLGDDRSGTQ